MISFLKSVWLSFYSRDFYKNYVRQGKGFGGCLILFQTFLLLILPICAGIVVLPEMKMKIAEISAQLPEITIKNYKISMDKASPYKIDLAPDSKKEHPIVVFDTDNKFINIDDLQDMMSKQHIIMLVSSDFIAVPGDLHSAGKINLYYLRDQAQNAKETHISHQDWEDFGKAVAQWGAPTIVVTLALILLSGNLIALLCKGVLLLMLFFFSTLKPTLGQTMRLSAAASTPVTLATIAGGASHLPIPSYVYTCLWGVYALYGFLWANRAAREDKSNLPLG